MTKAILINAKARTITEHTINSWRDIAPAIGCELFTCVGLDRNGETAYVDDMGLLTQPTNFIKFESYPQPLAGSALILGTDHEGESVDTKLTVEEVGKMVKFLTVEDVRNGRW